LELRLARYPGNTCRLLSNSRKMELVAQVF
jgi:hypothetical protein